MRLDIEGKAELVLAVTSLGAMAKKAPSSFTSWVKGVFGKKGGQVEAGVLKSTEEVVAQYGPMRKGLLQLWIKRVSTYPSYDRKRWFYLNGFFVIGKKHIGKILSFLLIQQTGKEDEVYGAFTF